MTLTKTRSSHELLFVTDDGDSVNETIRRCSECSFWIKYCLFSINFFIWVGGVCLVIIGIWARLEKAKRGSFDNLSLDPAFFLLVVGCVMFCISLFGCFGSLREDICLLKSFGVVVVVVFVIEVFFGVLTVFFIQHVRQNLLHFLHSGIVSYQDNSELKVSMDYLQKRFSCCGGESYNDWDVNVYYNCSSPALSRCGVPISCCRVPSNVQCGFHTRIEDEVYAAHTIYTKGCIHFLMLILKDNLIIIGLITFGVGLVELFSILLAHSLVKEITLAKKQFTEQSSLKLNVHKIYDSTDIT